MQGFFKMLATSPKTVSLAAGVACMTPYLLREKSGLPATYTGFFSVAAIFFLTLFAVLVVRACTDGLRESGRAKKARKARFEGLALEELEVLAAFVIQQVDSLFYPSDLVVISRLWRREMLVCLHTPDLIQRFEIADWARKELELDPSLLKGTDGAHAVSVSTDYFDRKKNGEYAARR